MVGSLPALLASLNRDPSLSVVELAACGLWVVGFAGETTADRQRLRFTSNPANDGLRCQTGLWQYSRNADRLFELLIWVAYAIFGLTALWPTCPDARRKPSRLTRRTGTKRAPTRRVEMSPTSAETTSSRRHRPLAKKPWFWALVSLVAILVVLGAMFTSVVPMSSDVLRQRIIATLSDRLDSDVQLGDLSIRVFPGLRADGKDLRIRRRGTPADLPPLISIKSFHVDANLMGLWRKHVDHVQLDGLEISIPPKQVRVQQKEAERAADAADPAKINKPEATPEEKRQDPLKAGGVVLDRVDTDDARLVLIPGKPGKAPKVWAIHHLRMHDLGSTNSWPFKATLTNGVPPGEIETAGGFGPWDRNEPGDTPRRRHLQLREGRPRSVQGHLGHARVAWLFRRHAGPARSQRRNRHTGLHHQGRRPPVPAACEVQGAHRRHERRHAPAEHRRVVPQLVPPRRRRGARRTEGRARTHGVARRRDGQVAHRRHHEDGREGFDAPDDRRA